MGGRHTALGVTLLVVFVVAASSPAIMRRGAGTSPDEASSLYERAATAAEAGDCATALPLLEKALEETPEDADALNVLGYCQRKTGRLDEAFESYRRALEARPRFPAARQYLGEAHVQAALREIEILRGYGDEGREELSALAATLREAAAAAPKHPPPSVTPAPRRW